MRDFPEYKSRKYHTGAEGASQSEWAGRRVLIVGMARSGVAAAKLLCRAGARVTINDMKEESAFKGALDELKELPVNWQLGQDAVPLLANVDVLVISPGVPIDAPVVAAAKEQKLPVLGELEMASRFLRGTLLAVTGTNGKTTTVSLLGEIFREAGKIVHVAGNIGYPLSAAALSARSEDIVIAEVSSFQLETIERFTPAVAAVLNVTEDHLNRHGTMAVYSGLKRHIFVNQGEGDVAVLNYDDAACRDMAAGLKGKVAFFSRQAEVPQGAFVRDGSIIVRFAGEERAVCRTDEIRIPGPHNLENALAATIIAFVRGVPAPVIRHALRTFQGVEHRIEFVAEKSGVRYINDSKGTNVDSTIKAVEAMTLPTAIILGGYDKHVSFAPLAEHMAQLPLIRHAVLIGQTAPQLEQALKEAGFTAITPADTLEEAVLKARELSAGVGNVLFSPACASFDMFEDYEQRGRVFKQIVQNLDN